LLREIVKQPGETQFVESRGVRFSQEYQFSLRLFDPPMSMTLTAKEAEEILLPEFMSGPRVNGRAKAREIPDMLE